MDDELLMHWFSVNSDRWPPQLNAVPIGVLDSRPPQAGQDRARTRAV